MRRASVLLPFALAGVASLSACGSSSGSGSGSPNANGLTAPATTAAAPAATAAGPSATSGAVPSDSAGASADPSNLAAAGGTVVQVVAAENFWGDITRQIGGTHVKVTSIVTDPNADPHSYETDPKDAAAISAASFVVLNGLGYDDFASKLLAASPNASRTVISLDKVNAVNGDNPNPHLWYNPVYVRASADAIAAQLSKVDPADRASYAANEKTFLAAYQPYIDTLATIKSTYRGAKIAFTERVPGYLVDAAGLTLATPASFAQSIEDGNDPSPQDAAAIDTAMKNKTVKILLYNGQVTSPTTQQVQDLAKTAGIPVVGVAETIPATYPNFQSWQIGQAQQILKALGG